MKITNNHLVGLSLIGAIVVAASGHDGWGWLLFIAVIFWGV
jgi:hypothetical protein